VVSGSQLLISNYLSRLPRNHRLVVLGMSVYLRHEIEEVIEEGVGLPRSRYPFGRGGWAGVSLTTRYNE